MTKYWDRSMFGLNLEFCVLEWRSRMFKNFRIGTKLIVVGTALMAVRSATHRWFDQ